MEFSRVSRFLGSFRARVSVGSVDALSQRVFVCLGVLLHGLAGNKGRAGAAPLRRAENHKTSEHVSRTWPWPQARWVRSRSLERTPTPLRHGGLWTKHGDDDSEWSAYRRVWSGNEVGGSGRADQWGLGPERGESSLCGECAELPKEAKEGSRNVMRGVRVQRNAHSVALTRSSSHPASVDVLSGQHVSQCLSPRLGCRADTSRHVLELAWLRNPTVAGSGNGPGLEDRRNEYGAWEETPRAFFFRTPPKSKTQQTQTTLRSRTHAHRLFPCMMSSPPSRPLSTLVFDDRCDSPPVAELDNA